TAQIVNRTRTPRRKVGVMPGTAPAAEKAEELGRRKTPSKLRACKIRTMMIPRRCPPRRAARARPPSRKYACVSGVMSCHQVCSWSNMSTSARDDETGPGNNTGPRGVKRKDRLRNRRSQNDNVKACGGDRNIVPRNRNVGNDDGLSEPGASATDGLHPSLTLRALTKLFPSESIAGPEKRYAASGFGHRLSDRLFEERPEIGRASCRER